MFFPLFYQSRSGEDRTFLTPLVARRQAGGRDTWILSPLVSWFTRDGRQRELWFLGPIARARWGAGPGASHIVPLYYYNGDKRLFLSPVSFYSWDQDASLLVTPLYSARKQGNDGWRLIPPILYQGRDGEDRTLLTPLLARKSSDDSDFWLLVPMLSWFKRDGSKRQFWLLGPLGHARWDGVTSSSHFFPLYYHNSAAGVFLSPLFGWKKEGDSGLASVLGPLYVQRWKGEDGWRLIFPFLYHSRSGEDRTVLTPLFGKKRTGERDAWIFTPLLSSYAREGKSRELWFLAPFFRARWDDKTTSSHLLPFYYHNGSTGTFLTPLLGWAKRPDAGLFHVLAPLFIHSWEKGRGYRWFALFPFVSGYDKPDEKGSWFWPLYSYKRHKWSKERKGFAVWPLFHYAFGPNRSRMLLLPIFKYFNGETYRFKGDDVSEAVRRKSFYSLPSFWYRSDRKTKHGETESADQELAYDTTTGFWPLWHYKSRADGLERRSQKDFSVLGWLFDYRHLVTPKEEGEGLDDYARWRVLWRAMHYERLNEDTSLDMFPFITYDRKPSGFRKFSFAWRFLRYERGDDRGLKVDFLFIPILRSKEKLSVQPAAAESSERAQKSLSQ